MIKPVLKIILRKLNLLLFFRKLNLLLYSYLNLPRDVKIPLDKDEIILNTRDWATANFCRNKIRGSALNYEPVQTKIFSLVASRSKVIFDVGGQIGYYTLLAAKLGADHIVYFDINELFVGIARKHVRRNQVEDKVELVCGAIGEQRKIIKFENFCGVITDKTFSLDFFCSDRKIYPDFLKIDIEGFELELLRGANTVLSRKPIILLALHPKFIAKRGKSVREVFEILFRKNYRIFALSSGKEGEEVTKERIDEFTKKLTIDFICIPTKSEIIEQINKTLSMFNL
jgi:FkbM family methyltransferase